jgi:hypothetical protein
MQVGAARNGCDREWVAARQRHAAVGMCRRKILSWPTYVMERM